MAKKKKTKKKSNKSTGSFLDRWAESYKAYAPLVLRLILGIAFILHGYGKLNNFEIVVSTFDRWGFGPANFFVSLIILIELGGGILVLLGLFTRYAAAAIAIAMLVAVFKVHIGILGQGFEGYQLPLLYAFNATALVLLGSGIVSLDDKLKLNR